MKKLKNIKQRLFENMVKLNPDFKLNQEVFNMNESYGRPDPLGTNMAEPMNEDDVQQDSSIQYRAEVAGVRENVWSTNAKVFNSEEDAKAYLDDLGSRWFGFDMSRVVPVTTPQGEQVDFADPNIYQNYRKK